MLAWSVVAPGPVEEGSLRPTRKPVPVPADDELLLRVRACGVCRTDLHVTEGDLPEHRAGVTPGHEVVGVVVSRGASVRGYAAGERVGVAWLRRTDGTCGYCLRGAENLCPASRYTGWDADGGYARYATVPAAFAHRLPDGLDDVRAAPLLCAGIIGFRALRRAALPPGGRLGLYGFGGSAHLCAQVALAEGATVHVMTRGARARDLALALGAASAQDAYAAPPEPLDSAILFAPVGALVPVALRALDRGGVLAVAGIHLSDTPPLRYESELFYEKELRSVTSSTREDAREFLALATRYGVRATTHTYPLARADEALRDLKAGRFEGAAVLVDDAD
ncbi:zinc-binding alcohol dehydrogenase family protein [Streptomyces sp. YU58]|uniref:zinc-binding alcohol dehydrogenase family protein n=1 Tax=Streptomyces sp. SX92 TaxID=3158972 RepID=UPI0027BA1626|nr:zinc-binding alcohol dehydrogenase family protein [Streptomyces coralus]WLW58757.1 zinc-binding alcohol dehydrogenase family protein [Streptomyces coralus]